VDPWPGVSVSPRTRNLFLRIPSRRFTLERALFLLKREGEIRRAQGEPCDWPSHSLYVEVGGHGGEADLCRDLVQRFEREDPESGPLPGKVRGEARGLPEWTIGLTLLPFDDRERGPTGVSVQNLTPTVLGSWVDAGVNRISLTAPAGGPDEGGKGSGVEVLREAYERIRDAGLARVSAELEIGRGGGGRGDDGRALARILGTLETWIDCGVPQVALVEEEGGDTVEESVGEPVWLQVDRILMDRGYQTQDGVHYSRSEGGEPLHPRAIRRREPILGLGPGAVTFRNPERRANVGEEKEYAEKIRAGLDPWLWRETLTPKEVRMERMWWGLRSRRGLPVRLLGPRARSKMGEWRGEGWVEERGGRWVLRPEGWLKADGLAVELLLADEQDRCARDPRPEKKSMVESTETGR